MPVSKATGRQIPSDPSQAACTKPSREHTAKSDKKDRTKWPSRGLTAWAAQLLPFAESWYNNERQEKSSSDNQCCNLHYTIDLFKGVHHLNEVTGSDTHVTVPIT